MTNYSCIVKEPYYSLLKEGKKTVEGRLARGKFLKVVPGDIIEVLAGDGKSSVDVEVTRVAYYSTFLEMLQKEGYSSVLPDVVSPEAGVEVYRGFYSEAEERACGVVAIGIRQKI